MPDRPATWHDIITAEATSAKVAPALALAVAEQESNFNPAARGKDTEIGLFQLKPGTAQLMGVDPNDPIQNIRGGVKYLRQQLDLHKGDVQKALGAYNAGPAGVPRPEYAQAVLARLSRYTGTGSTPASSTAPAGMSAEEAEGRRIKPLLPGLPGPRAPGAPPAPQRFERREPQASIVETLGRYKVLPTAGAIAGGIYGGGAAGPTILGVPVAAAAGAGAGAGLGEFGQTKLEEAVGLRGGPPTPRILSETGTGAAGEFGGGLVFRGVKKVAAPFLSRVTPEGLEATRALGGKVLPAQVTESRGLDIAQNVAEASLFGGGKIKAFKEAQDQLVEGLVTKELAKYGGPTAGETAGDAFVKGLSGQIDTFHQYARTLYGQLDQAAQGVQVPTTELKTWAAQEFQRRSAVPALSGDTSLSILQQITKLPDSLPFAEAQVIRSQALAKGRSLIDPDRDVLRGITEQISKHVDTSMEAAARQAGPQVEQAFRTANAFYKSGRERFETDFLRGLLEKEPDAVAKALTRNNSPVLIREARKAVPARAWKPVQAAMVTQLAERATNVETGQINGKAMLTQVKSLGPSLQEIFPTTAQEVKRLARVLSTVQTKQGEGTGRIYIQLAQAGAAAGIVTGTNFGSGEKAAAAGVILLGPRMLAKIMTSPRGIRWLTTGLTAPPGSQQAIRAATQLAAFATEAGLQDDEQTGPPPMPRKLIGYSAPPPQPRSVTQP